MTKEPIKMRYSTILFWHFDGILNQKWWLRWSVDVRTHTQSGFVKIGKLAFKGSDDWVLTTYDVLTRHVWDLSIEQKT